MRIALLIVFAGLFATACQGPGNDSQKSVEPRAVSGDRGDAATESPHARAPETQRTDAPSSEDPPTGSPGMGLMLDYESSGGLAINDVRPGGPADKAGLKPGDVIIEFGGIEIDNVQDYMNALSTVRIGDQVDIVVKRGGEMKTLKATVGVSLR